MLDTFITEFTLTKFMIGFTLAFVNMFLVLGNKSTLRIPGLDILPFVVAWSGSVSVMMAAVGLQLIIELENWSTAWIIAVAAFFAVFVAMWSSWAGLIVYYVLSVTIAFFAGMLGPRFMSFLAVNIILNGLLLVLFA